MELPKNITQIGESDKYCKVYAEDYVISYMKQMNRFAENKKLAIALYGTRKTESEMSYHFFYGAAKVNFLKNETRHLSQAQNQEIEKLRIKYFPEYEFLGYCILNGEMVEGFHIHEQGICRYIMGYAQFYEKNDCMLAYMLDTREEEIQPEQVDQEKYERVRLRQDERRSGEVREAYGAGRESERDTEPGESAQHSGKVISLNERKRFGAGSSASGSLRMMRMCVTGMFVLLCVLGVSTMGDSQKRSQLQASVRQFVGEISEQKLPDSQEAVSVMNQDKPSDTLVMEDKLAEAIQKENMEQEAVEIEPVPLETTASQESAEAPTETTTEVSEAEPSAAQEPTVEAPAAQEQTAAAQTAQTPPAPETASEASVVIPETYTIQAGDTLIGISMQVYGTEAKVKEICKENGIANADDIKIGQKIILP